MDAFAWTVVGSIAGVLGAAAAIFFGFVSWLPRRKEVETPPTRPATAASRANPPMMVGEIPQEPVGFQPRADLLASLEVSGRGSRVVVVHAFVGMRGVGKTHLAAAYARTKLIERWRLVAWIDAETLSGVLAGLAEVAAALKLDMDEAHAERAARAVRHQLEVDGDRCLLVFDNASDPDLLQPFIPVAGAARVIITSNQQSIANLGTGVPVDVFTKQEARAFLADRTGSTDADGADATAVELGYLPLALAQAAAVIVSQRLSYRTYLDRLHVMSVGDLLQPVRAGQYPQGLAAAVLLSLDAVRADDDSGACVAVMQLLAVLQPAGVPRALVHEAARHGFLAGNLHSSRLASEVADRAMAQLASTSLLTFSMDGSSVSAHRLVMRVIREQLEAEKAILKVCAGVADLLEGASRPLIPTLHHERPAVRDLVEQIMALYESSRHTSDERALGSQLTRLRERAIWFMNELGDDAVRSALVAESLLADLERSLGLDHPDTLAVRDNLAIAYRQAGRIAEAIALHEQTLAARERVLGPDHPDTLDVCNNLAIAYRQAGRIAEAIALHEQTLAARERVLGPDHPDTLDVCNNLAIAYRRAGRVTEAIALHEQTLADRERVLGHDHPDTLATRDNLANGYRRVGDIAKAINLHEQILADRERILGRNHPRTLATRNNLGLDYRRAGWIAEAIALHEQTLADRERILGPDHPETLATRDNLAHDYRIADRITEAIALYEQTLADRERILGPDHPDTLATRDNLTDVSRQTGRPA